MHGVLLFFLSFLGGIFLSFPIWVRTVYGERVTLEQMIFFIQSGLAGVAGTDVEIINSLTVYVFVVPLSVFLFLSLIYLLIKRLLSEKKQLFFKKMVTVFCLFFVFFNLFVLLDTIKIIEFYQSLFGRDSFSELYQDPEKIRYKTPLNKKNLVLIYVESLECDLLEIGPERINALKAIEDLPGYHVRNFMQAPGTHWSIAGMISSQAGVPLKPYYGNNIAEFIKKSYLPNLTSLSDVMERNGYVQYFLVGDDLRFAGKDKFFLGHGYDYAWGRDEWRAKGLDPGLFTSWGESLHDDALFEEAYRLIGSIAVARKPYVVTVVTMDTHFPEGFPSSKCKKEEKNSGFIGAFRCSSRSVSEFVQKLIDDDIVKNTDIIIMGDHLFMANKEQEKKYFSDKRRVYFKLITSDKRKPNRSMMTHFDVAPTILDLMGLLETSDTGFGLGKSLFSSLSDSQYKKHLDKVMNCDILNRSVVYDNFWSYK
jgi:phosphoglycerol transferase